MNLSNTPTTPASLSISDDAAMSERLREFAHDFSMSAIRRAIALESALNSQIQSQAGEREKFIMGGAK